MINKPFKGTLTKCSHFSKDNNVLVKFTVKHSEIGQVQFFLESIEKELKHKNIMSLFDYEVQWKSITLDASDWIKNYFVLDFDESQFDARLTEIKITRKSKQGSDHFDYIMTFQKELGANNQDSIFAKTYLNYKEEDENGKKIVILFDVNLTPTEEPKSTVNPNDNL